MKYLVLSLTALSLLSCATTEEKPTEKKEGIITKTLNNDRDGDGIVDVLDNCPDTAGTKVNHGCAVPQLVVLKADRVEILEKVYFATNSDQIEERSFKLLDNVATVLKVHPEINGLSIEGHTDNTGDHDYNVDLSQRRAASVVKYLVDHGIDESRLTAVGHGPDKPIAENDTDEGRAKNRRVEFLIQKG